MRSPGGNPNSPLRGHNPSAVPCPHSHNSPRGVNKLILLMKMFWYDVPVREIVRERRDKC